MKGPGFIEFRCLSGIKKIILCCLLVGLLILPLQAFAGKEYVAERFDVDIVVDSDGSMQVTETIAFRFMGGPFTYVYRDLEKTRTDGIAFLSAELDGNTLPVNDPAAFEWAEVEEGDPLNVTWHFQPTSDQTRIYALTYEVSGVVRKNSSDSILWMVIPPEHEYRSQGSLITVKYPAGTSLVSQPQLSGASMFQVQSDDNPLILTAGPVEADTPLVLTLDFTKGTLSDTTPAWQKDEQLRQERLTQTMPFLVAGFLTVLLGLMIALILIARKPLSMDETIPPPSANKPVAPPTDYKPAVAATLAARLNPNMMHALATLIDLASRGIISIEQLPAKWYDRNRFDLVRQPGSGNLAPHEQILMDALFIKRDQTVERIELKDYAQSLSRRWTDFSKAIKLEISLLGLIHPERKKKQTRLFVAGVGLAVGGFFLAIISAIVLAVRGTSTLLPWDEFTAALLGGFTAAFICGMIYIIFTALYTPLSAQGRWISSQWNGFAKYLKDIIAQREQPLRPDTFMKFLPYATAFGLGAHWAKTFQKRGLSEVPAWFHALDAADADGSYAVFSSFMTQSSAATSSGGGGGAGGASGGGGSGAG